MAKEKHNDGSRSDNPDEIPLGQIIGIGEIDDPADDPALVELFGSWRSATPATPETLGTPPGDEKE